MSSQGTSIQENEAFKYITQLDFLAWELEAQNTRTAD